MTGSNPEFVTSSSDSSGKLAAFGIYCSNNNIAIVNWSYRLVKDVVGLYVASQMDDETNYNLFQVYQLPDWEGDPEQNYWVNDIAMYRWLYTGAISQNLRQSQCYNSVEERKDSTTEWDDVSTDHMAPYDNEPTL